MRTAGRLLFFVDIVRKNMKLQVLVNYKGIPDSSITEKNFIASSKLLRRGDVISERVSTSCALNIVMTNFILVQELLAIHRTESGQLSLSATKLPRILSPCLHHFPVPKSAEDATSENETHFLDRHVDMLANNEMAQILLRRSHIIREMRNYLNIGGFVEVQTPIISSGAGGAVARPFETSATEFSDKQLSLRVAPELWLKRLILGGMDRIFEIGPCFRNEGESASNAILRSLTLFQGLANSIIQNLQLASFTARTLPSRIY